MKLSQYVLALVATGQLTKEAGAEAFSFEKKADGMNGNGVNDSKAAPGGMTDALKSLGVQLAVIKGLDLAGKGIGSFIDSYNAPNKDSVFQDLMTNHPGLKGKDPVRAKANLDYILDEMPHLADHPLILGDHVANMTALGATDPMTLKTIADIGKARHDMSKNEKSWMPESVLNDAGAMGKQMYLDSRPKPAAPAEQPPAMGILDEMKRRTQLRADLNPLRNELNDKIDNTFVGNNQPMDEDSAIQQGRNLEELRAQRGDLQQLMSRGMGEPKEPGQSRGAPKGKGRR